MPSKPSETRASRRRASRRHVRRAPVRALVRRNIDEPTFDHDDREVFIGGDDRASS